MREQEDLIKWQIITTHQSEGRGPGGVVYLLTFDHSLLIASGEVRHEIGHAWIASRGSTPLNDVAVGFDEARELCEADAREIDSHPDHLDYSRMVKDSELRESRAQITGEITGKLRRGVSPLPEHFTDNDHDGMS